MGTFKERPIFFNTVSAGIGNFHVTGTDVRYQLIYTRMTDRILNCEFSFKSNLVKNGAIFDATVQWDIHVFLYADL